jgi:hypothetical protein
MVGTNGAPKERENAAWQAIVAVVVVAASERERQRETETEKEFPSLLSFKITRVFLLLLGCCSCCC